MTDILTRKMHLALLRGAVSCTITCPATEQILDVRTAVLIDASDYGGRMMVVTGTFWDQHKDRVVKATSFTMVNGKPEFTATDFDVIDGRELHRR